jgi:hypothetical protein
MWPARGLLLACVAVLLAWRAEADPPRFINQFAQSCDAHPAMAYGKHSEPVRAEGRWTGNAAGDMHRGHAVGHKGPLGSTRMARSA